MAAGTRAFERYNCNHCHMIVGFGGHHAPDFTRAHLRLAGNGVVCQLKSPEAAFAGCCRKTPQHDLPAKDMADIMACLRWVSDI